MTYVQVRLRKDNSVLTTWIEKKKGVKKDSKITLREYKDEWWIIEEMFGEMDSKDLLNKQKMNKHFWEKEG